MSGMEQEDFVFLEALNQRGTVFLARQRSSGRILVARQVPGGQTEIFETLRAMSPKHVPTVRAIEARQDGTAFVYEDVCREKMWELSAANTWNYHFDKVGSYWGAKAGEIDIVGIDTASGNLVLGECKYTTSPKGLSVLHALQEKSEAMLKLTQTKNVQYILFSTAGFTQGLIDEAGNNSNIKLMERL